MRTRPQLLAGVPGLTVTTAGIVDCLIDASLGACTIEVVGTTSGVAGDVGPAAIRDGEIMADERSDLLRNADVGKDDVCYCGDTSSPDKLFRGSFQPRKPRSDTSLEDYVDYNMPSNYVGTTKNPPTGDASPGTPGEFATDGGTRPGYIYEIDRPSNGVDVNEQYPDGPFKHENEVAIPGGISGNCIRGGTPVGSDGAPTGDFIRNPDYTGGN